MDRKSSIVNPNPPSPLRHRSAAKIPKGVYPPRRAVADSKLISSTFIIPLEPFEPFRGQNQASQSDPPRRTGSKRVAPEEARFERAQPVLTHRESPRDSREAPSAPSAKSADTFFSSCSSSPSWFFVKIRGKKLSEAKSAAADLFSAS